ncbi:PilZ domain-containing protein [Stomatohabitans albus]|uniref:flagellar brake protein n=1 Tax=Stomatohabitans albus TaxID=3110766 RepID=UPI00300CCEE3
MSYPEPRTPLTVVTNDGYRKASTLTATEDEIEVLWGEDPSGIEGEIIVRWSAGAALYEAPCMRNDNAITRSTLSVCGNVRRIQRRDAFRVPIDMRVTIEGEELSATGISGDISEGGISIFVRNTRDLAHNEVIQCSFTLNEKSFITKAKVIRTDEVVRGTRVALSWVDPSSQMMDTIRKAVFDAQLRPGFRQ